MGQVLMIVQRFRAYHCEGFFGAFGAVMFAFGGASTFPTVQADMADKKKFKWAAVASCVALLAIYSSVMVVSYRAVHVFKH